MHLEKAIPNLPVKNVPESIKHYCEVLGFKLDWDDAVVGTPEVMYACISRDDFKLCLTAHSGPGAPAEIWCYVDDIKALYKDLTSRGAEFPKGLEEMPWGEIELDYRDPDGNRVGFTQRAPK